MLPTLEFGSDLLVPDETSTVHARFPYNDKTTAVPGFADNVSDAPISLRVDGVHIYPTKVTKPTPFQESRNFWKRNIAAHTKKPSSAPECDPLSPKRSYRIGCTTDRQSINSQQAISSSKPIGGDNESTLITRRFCRPSAIPVWPHLRQARHRHSTPAMKSSKIASARRKLSANPIYRPETRVSPSRSTLPKRVRSKSKLPFLQLSPIMSDEPPLPDDVKENEILVRTEVEIYKEMIEPDGQSSPKADPAVVDVWNDPSEQQKFTATWRDHQDGHTSKDTYLGRLPFETSATPKTPIRGQGQSLTSPKSHRNVDSSTVGSPRSGPVPPKRISSKPNGVGKAMLTSANTLEPKNEVHRAVKTRAESTSSYLSKPKLRPDTVKRTTNLPPSSIPVRVRSNLNTKCVRSVESISQIEALFPPTFATHEDKNLAATPPTNRKKSTTKLRNSPPNITPAGDPPVRPLPDLPRDHTTTPTSVLRISTSKTPHDTIAEDVEKVETPTAKRRTSQAGPDSSNRKSIVKENDKSFNTPEPLAIDLSESSESHEVLSSSPEAESIGTPDSEYSHDSPLTSRLRGKPRTKNISTSRSEKVRKLKQKHLAAMSKSKTLSSDQSDDLNKEDTLLAETIVEEPINEGSPGAHSFPPPPPLPSSPRNKHYHSFTTPSKSRKDGIDELDQFPAVPLSRPGSRASAAPTVQSVRGITRTNSSPRKSRSRARTVQGRRPSINRDSQQAVGQYLSFSVIYINVDTDPDTISFRASTVSRSSSRSPRSRSASSPRKTEKASEQAIGIQRPFENNRPCKDVNVSEKGSSPHKSRMLHKKQSQRSLKSQASTTRNAAKHGLGRVSPATFSRPNSKHNQGILSSDADSDSDREHPGFIPKRVSSARPGSKASSRSKASRRRKEHTMAEMPMPSPFDMEHVLMALARCQNQGVDISLLTAEDVENLAQQQRVQDEIEMRKAKRLSIVQRTQRPSGARIEDVRKTLDVKSRNSRPRSDISTITVNGTDTDASANTRASDPFSTGKRGSAGSLTDPTEYEMFDIKPLNVPNEPKVLTEHPRLIRTRRRPSSPTLSNRSYSYYQAQHQARQIRPTNRLSTLYLPPSVAPPRTTSRLHTDLVNAALNTNVDEIIADLEDTSTSDPFMLGMLDGMNTWTNPTIKPESCRTWGDGEGDSERLNVISTQRALALASLTS